MFAVAPHTRPYTEGPVGGFAYGKQVHRGPNQRQKNLERLLLYLTAHLIKRCEIARSSSERDSLPRRLEMYI